SYELAKQGAKVAVHWHRTSPETGSEVEESLVQRIKALGSEVVHFQGDLNDEEQVRQLVANTAAALGGLDILVNNVGDMVRRQPLAGMEYAFFQEVMDVNVKTMLTVTREALPYLAKAQGASVVNLSSLAGRKGGAGGSLAYSTAKGAVVTFTRALAAEVAAQGIRVNCVAPGLILNTKFHATYSSAEAIQNTIAGIPLGRAGAPEDVARAVAFLASEYDGFITGVSLDINGGVYMA
ncbi:MAG TPA: SDR family oxidoreductase, partial [Bacillota bacterium]|nr:SDR family oxidoreductase [Bacillota bacterium]